LPKVKRPEDFNHAIPTLSATATTTAILEAGRRSLDEQRFVKIVQDPSTHKLHLE
jgi:hypothetical protein